MSSRLAIAACSVALFVGGCTSRATKELADATPTTSSTPSSTAGPTPSSTPASTPAPTSPAPSTVATSPPSTAVTTAPASTSTPSTAPATTPPTVPATTPTSPPSSVPATAGTIDGCPNLPTLEAINEVLGATFSGPTAKADGGCEYTGDSQAGDVLTLEKITDPAMIEMLWGIFAADAKPLDVPELPGAVDAGLALVLYKTDAALYTVQGLVGGLDQLDSPTAATAVLKLWVANGG